MSLVTLNELLPEAKKNNYAIPALNVVNFDMIVAAVRAAEKEQSPIIIEYTENDDNRLPLEYIGKFANQLANDSDIPICVHLDHGNTLEGIIRAIKSGFSSVMYDGSVYSYEDNLKNTKEIVRIANSVGISVEAELGSIKSGRNNFTDPKVVNEFTKETGISALAISFGTEHGVYKNKPFIDLERLKEINTVTDVPLVMHGGSGLDTEVYKKVIDNGISKINYYSAMSNRVTNKIILELRQKNENKDIYLQDLVDLELDYFEDEMRSIIKVFQNN